MLNNNLIDEISSKLSAALQNSPAKDIEKNAKAILMQGLAKLDIVTREEFDIQAEMLSRARIQLSELEKRITELEGNKTSKPDDGSLGM